VTEPMARKKGVRERPEHPGYRLRFLRFLVTPLQFSPLTLFLPRSRLYYWTVRSPFMPSAR
jgi:hypothetical protein